MKVVWQVVIIIISREGEKVVCGMPVPDGVRNDKRGRGIRLCRAKEQERCRAGCLCNCLSSSQPHSRTPEGKMLKQSAKTPIGKNNG